MKLLAVTCATGSTTDAAMTSECARGLRLATPGNIELTNVCVAQDLKGTLFGFDSVVEWKKNKGFGSGMNGALAEGFSRCPYPDFVLVYNNDLLWSDRKAIAALVAAAMASFPSVFCPLTTYTSQPKQMGESAQLRPNFRVDFAPAIAWFMPRTVVTMRKNGFFPEDLGLAWYEDNYVAHWMSLHVHKQPFVIVPSAWVHHIGSVTSRRVSDEAKRASKALYHEKLKTIAEDL